MLKSMPQQSPREQVVRAVLDELLRSVRRLESQGWVAPTGLMECLRAVEHTDNPDQVVDALERWLESQEEIPNPL